MIKFIITSRSFQDMMNYAEISKNIPVHLKYAKIYLRWGCKLKVKCGEKGGVMVFELNLVFGLIKTKIILFNKRRG